MKMSKRRSLECSFCGRYIARPEITKTEFDDILSGACMCGAVYVYDRTGRNVGEAYMEALVLAKGDLDIGDISEGVDYQTVDIDYDLKTDRAIHSGGDRRSIYGKLVFVKLKAPDTEGLISPRNPEITRNNRQISSVAGGSKIEIKKRLKGLLASKSYKDIVDMALQRKSVVSMLISFTYDKEDIICWRAMEAMGLIAREFFIGQDSERRVVIRDTISRLLWSMREESGGVGWGLAGMLGEIIRCNPDEFSEIVPIVWSLREEEVFRPTVVWAMGRIASIRPDLIQFISGELKSILSDKDPAARGYAAWIIGILRDKSALENIKKLIGDRSQINFYRDGELIKEVIGEIANKAMEQLAQAC